MVWIYKCSYYFLCYCILNNINVNVNTSYYMVYGIYVSDFAIIYFNLSIISLQSDTSCDLLRSFIAWLWNFELCETINDPAKCEVPCVIRFLNARKLMRWAHKCRGLLSNITPTTLHNPKQEKLFGTIWRNIDLYFVWSIVLGFFSNTCKAVISVDYF